MHGGWYKIMINKLTDDCTKSKLTMFSNMYFKTVNSREIWKHILVRDKKNIHSLLYFLTNMRDPNK